jgi:prevent-host-death family protein
MPRYKSSLRLGALLDLVEQGEEVLITRHGKPAARLVAAVSGYDKRDALKAVEEIRRMRKGVTLGGIPIKELIEEGRK